MTRPEEFAEQIADMYVNGISTRKIKKALEAVAGKKVRASRSTVSRITNRLRDEFAQWKKRDLSDLKGLTYFLMPFELG